MKKQTIWMIALAGTLALALAAIAPAAAPTVVRVGDLVFEVDGDLTPKALPKQRLAPVTLHVHGSLASADGSQPAALKEVVLDSDRNAVLNATGLPACRFGELEARTTAAAKRACPDAIVGRGHATVRVALPEQTPFDATGPLVIFNGGVRDGLTTLYFHVYVDVPAPTAVVTTLKATKEHKGRYGVHSITRIPVIAGGAGSVTDFEFTLHRLFAYGGRTQSFLEARCSGGHFSVVAEFKFRDGDDLTGDFTRPCTATG